MPLVENYHAHAQLFLLRRCIGVSVLQSAQQASNGRSVFDSFCELSKVVHQSLYAFYSPVVATTSRDLRSIYIKYLNWYDHIPEALRLGVNFTPAVLFTQYVLSPS
jgi:hypothetical protein